MVHRYCNVCGYLGTDNDIITCSQCGAYYCPITCGDDTYCNDCLSEIEEVEDEMEGSEMDTVDRVLTKLEEQGGVSEMDTLLDNEVRDIKDEQLKVKKLSREITNYKTVGFTSQIKSEAELEAYEHERLIRRELIDAITIKLNTKGYQF